MSNHWSKPGLFVCKYNSVFILKYNSMFMGYKVVKWCMSLNICSHRWFAVGIKQSSSVTRCCTCECTLYSEVFITINKCWYHTWHWVSFCILVLVFCVFFLHVRSENRRACWRIGKEICKMWFWLTCVYFYKCMARTDAAWLVTPIRRRGFTQTHNI